MWLRSKPDNIIKISDFSSIRLLQIIFLPTILATIYEYQPTGFWDLGLGTWIWDLDLGLGFGTGLGLHN